MKFVDITESNFHHVLQIYSEGLDTGMSTFETQLPTWERWHQGHLPYGRLLLIDADHPLGWVALSPVSSRAVYRGVAEISIYVSACARGNGIGSMLMERLIQESEANQIYSLQAGIFPNNIGSLALHRKHGFRRIGHKERIAQLHGQWHDNVLMERRSQKVGL